MFAGNRRIPRSWRLTSIDFNSSVAWRKLLAATLLIGAIGFFTFSHQLPHEDVKNVTKEDSQNSAALINDIIPKNESKPRNILNHELKLTSLHNHCRIQECRIIKCSSILGHDSGEVASDFIRYVFKMDCKHIPSVNLILENCRFPINKLEYNWLRTDISIDELTLDNCGLHEIADDTFSLSIYEGMKRISLLNNKIQCLKRIIFRNLPNLQELTIRNNILRRAEYNLLEHVSGTLESLQLDGAIEDSKVLQNITGGETLLKVKILSLRENIISVINEKMFAGVPEVQSLYIDNSKVTEVMPGAFQQMAPSIRQLIMSYNNISLLTPGVLEHVIHYNQEFRVGIDNNPWHCDCNLKWMQTFMREYPSIITNILICKTPKKNALKTFDEAIFCDNDDSTSSTTTIQNEFNITETDQDVSSIDHSEDPEDKVNLTCTSYSDMLPNWYSRKLLFAMNYYLQSRFPNFTVSESSNGSLLVNLPNLDENVALLWFDNDHLEGSIRCAKNIKNSYLLSDIEPGTTYLICLIDEEEHAMSPLNCLPITTNPIYEARTWLTNGDKEMVFSLSTVSIIIICIISALLMFILIRKRPSLLRGSKRVLLVKRRDVDVIVLPKGVEIDEESEKCGNNVGSISNKLQGDGYVTPIPPIRFPFRQDSSISRMSFQSDGNSYVSSVEPTAIQLASWRLRRLKSELQKCANKSPPLPPHPRPTIPSLSMRIDAKRQKHSEFLASTV